MNASLWQLVRAVRGPLLLITFGTLMVLNHTNRLDFERSWPILVIAYGVLKLLERVIGQPVPPDVPPQWQQPGYTAQAYPPPPPQYPPVYPPPQTPQGGAQ